MFAPLHARLVHLPRPQLQTQNSDSHFPPLRFPSA